MAKAAIVTGGGSGIGAEIARTLAARGVNVAVNHRGDEDCDLAVQVAAQCREAGVEAIVVEADIAEEAACSRLVEQAAAAWGRLDYLVNNAAFSHGRPLTDIDAVDPSEIEKSFRVNTVAPFLLSRAAAPRMREGGDGAIVNISSMAGLIGFGSSYGYCLSKAALNNLTLALARTFAPHVRVNAVCPALVDTPWPRAALGDRFEAVAEAAARSSPLGRMLQPSEIAVPVVFLLMDAAQMTGEIVRIDGGVHLAGQSG